MTYNPLEDMDDEILSEFIDKINDRFDRVESRIAERESPTSDYSTGTVLDENEVYLDLADEEDLLVGTNILYTSGDFETAEFMGGVSESLVINEKWYWYSSPQVEVVRTTIDAFTGSTSLQISATGAVIEDELSGYLHKTLRLGAISPNSEYVFGAHFRAPVNPVMVWYVITFYDSNQDEIAQYLSPENFLGVEDTWSFYGIRTEAPEEANFMQIQIYFNFISNTDILRIDGIQLTGIVTQTSDTDDHNLIAPKPPTDFTLSTSLGSGSPARPFTATITATWNLPTENEDETPLLDLGGFQLYTSPDGVTYSPASSLIDNIQTEYDIVNLLPNTLYYVSIKAFDWSGNASTAEISSITTVQIPPPEDVTNVVLVGNGIGGGYGTCDELERNDLSGYLVRMCESTNEYTATGTPSWGSWSTQILFPTEMGHEPRFDVLFSQTNIWAKISVKAIVMGGTVSENWVESNSIVVYGINPGDFNLDLNAEIADLVGSGAVYYANQTGAVYRNGKLLFITDDSTDITVSGVSSNPVTAALRIGMQSSDGISYYPQVAAFDDAGHKALLGQSGSFWGLYIENGLINVKTGNSGNPTLNSQIVIDSEGIRGYTGASGAPAFDLNTDALTMRGSNIYMLDGGLIQLGGTSEGSVSGVVRLTEDGLIVKDTWGYEAVNLGELSPGEYGLILDGTNDDVIIQIINGTIYGSRIENTDVSGNFIILDGTKMYFGGGLVDETEAGEIYSWAEPLSPGEDPSYALVIRAPKVTATGQPASIELYTNYSDDFIPGRIEFNIPLATKESAIRLFLSSVSASNYGFLGLGSYGIRDGLTGIAIINGPTNEYADLACNNVVASGNKIYVGTGDDYFYTNAPNGPCFYDASAGKYYSLNKTEIV